MNFVPDANSAAPPDGRLDDSATHRVQCPVGRLAARDRRGDTGSAPGLALGPIVALARGRFDQMVATVGRRGIRQVLNRESSLGPDFFRAVDAVKKRAHRERRFQPLEACDVVATARDDETQAEWRGALQEAIDRSPRRREASLIHATLKGETPAEIASRWGVAPKTVSNEKARVVQKLRDVLVADPAA